MLAELVDEWPRPTEKIKLKPNKKTKKKRKTFLVSQEKRNLQGHTTEVAASKVFFIFFIPGVHGKNPRRTAAPASHGSS